MRCTGALLLSTLAAACGPEVLPGGAEGSGPFVRDSAGIRIVENEKVRPDGMRAETEPVFTLGWGEDEPAFTWIQSGRILPDGGALVGDFAAGAIYRIGADGSVRGTWGRKGEGPGEYQSLDGLLLRGDSIIVSDGRLLRVTVLSTEGTVLATRPLPGAFLHQISSILADGRLLLIPGDGYSSVGEQRSEWVFERRPILAASLDGSVDTLAELPHLRRWYGTRGGSPGPVPVKGRAGGFEDGFAWSRSDQPEVRWFDATGKLVRIARWDEEPAPLTAEIRNRMVSRMEAAFRARGVEESFLAAQLLEIEEGLDRHDGPLPRWDDLHVDRDGNAWLHEWSPPGEPSSRWRVINRDGTFTGWIDLPGVIDILDITEDRVLAVRFDEMDVSAAVMIRLIRP
jgi:hypothetical protein